MRLLRMHRATVKRASEVTGVWNDSGDYEDAAERECIPITCCVQPTFSRSEYQKKLPEGVTIKDCREIYTHNILQTGDEHSQHQADIVEFEGREYEVFENNPWDTISGRLTHHRAIMIRRDKLPNPNYPKASTGGISWR